MIGVNMTDYWGGVNPAFQKAQPKEGQVFTAIDILNMDSVDIVADIGKPEFSHHFANFPWMDTIAIRKSFLDAILPYNQTWWTQCESLIKHVSIA